MKQGKKADGKMEMDPQTEARRKRWDLASANIGPSVIGGGLPDPMEGDPAEVLVPVDWKKYTRCCRLPPSALYFAFVLLWTAWLVNSRDSEMSYSFGQLVKERIIHSELLPIEDEVATTFSDVTSTEGVRQFLRGPFLDGLFGDQESKFVGTFDPGYVNSQARLIGAARLTQIRVATNSCTVSLLRVFNPTCYPSLNDGKRRRGPIYGQNLGGGMRRVYRYHAPKLRDLPYMALANGYLPGGYRADLPGRKLHAASVLDQLEQDAFLSIETRALIVDFSLYNPNINTFCIVRLAFEHFHTGGVQPSADVRTVRLLPYEGDSGELQLLLDGLIITYVSLLFLVHLRALRIARRTAIEQGQIFRLRHYLSGFWIFWDWLFVGFFWGILSSKYYIRGVMKELEQQAPFHPNIHYPLFAPAQAAQAESNLISICSLLVIFKVFKYMKAVPIVDRLFQATRKAAGSLTGFVVVFGVVLFAFTMAFHIGFGLVSKDFRDLGTTFITLFRFVLGDVDVDEILNHNAVLGTFLVILFTFLGYLILIGIGVAILVSYYSAEPDQSRQVVEFLQNIVATRNKLLRTGKSDLRMARAELKKLVAFAVKEAWIQLGLSPRRQRMAADAGSSLRKKKAEKQPPGGAVVSGEWIPQDATPMQPVDDPMREAEKLFGEAADTAENRSYTHTRTVITSLKSLYLELVDSEAEHAQMLAEVLPVITALRDENVAIAHALDEKAVVLDPELAKAFLSPTEEELRRAKEDTDALAALQKKVYGGGNESCARRCNAVTTTASGGGERPF